MEGFSGRVRWATPADAPAITQLIRACYGDTYCVPEGVDPAHVARAIAAERELYLLACEPSGRIVGQAALIEKARGAFECARVVVDVSQRQRGLMAGLTRQLFEQAPARTRLLSAGAVTSHPFGQRNGEALGMTPVGLLLAQYPAWMRVAGFPPGEVATSAVLFARGTPRLRRPRRLGVLGADAAFAREVLAGLGVPLGAPPTVGGRLRWSLTRNAELGLSHLQLGRRGAVHAPWVDLDEGPRRLQWADVPVEHPAAASWCDALRRRGFGLAAYLPLGGPVGEDVLRLQRLDDDAAGLEELSLVPRLQPLQRLVLREQRSGARV